MGKPRLIFFRSTWSGVPPYIKATLDQQLNCLEKSFTVKVIPGSCDFDRECSAFEPDMALFESGAYAQERTYANLNTHPHLPRLGFLNADAYCLTRSVFMSDMDRWGVADFFTLSVSMAEYFPAIADRLYVWANCIDRTLFDLPPLRKNIPALFIGSEASHYPWRISVHEKMAEAMPTLTVPRQGWNVQTSYMPQGQAYATMLGESWFVPACGTIAKDVVRKHFEIPAAGACLVAERTAALEAAGFEDMVNCVFADADDVVDKLNALKNEPEKLQAVIEAGRALVMERHCQENRDQMLQWFHLQAGLRPDQKIVQHGPFGRLERIAASQGGNRHVVSGGTDRALLADGYAALLAGRPADAEGFFLRCLNYHWMPEAVRGLALVALKRGDPAGAEERMMESVGRMRDTHLAVDSDPVEWSLTIRAAVCSGDLGKAVERARSFPRVQHLELRRMQIVLDCLAATARPATQSDIPDRPSVHDAFLIGSPRRWLEDLCFDLRRCGQLEMAALLLERQPPVPPQLPTTLTARREPPLPGLAAVASGVRRRDVLAMVKRRVRRLRSRLAGVDPFCRELANLATKSAVRQALICGKDPDGELIAALTKGSHRNSQGPVAVRSVFNHARDGGISIGSNVWIEPDVDSRDRGGMLVVAAHQTDLDASWLDHAMPFLVAVEATDSAAGSRLMRHLRDSPSYDLVRIGRERQGFAIFRKIDGAAAPRTASRGEDRVPATIHLVVSQGAQDQRQKIPS